MKKILVYLLVTFSLQCFAQQASTPTFVKDSLDAYVQSGLEKWQIPGVAVCIVKDGKEVLMKGYGVREINTTDKVDENTLFLIGSNTKAFTATAMAMLDAGKDTANKFSLDDKVTKWLPWFKLANKAAGEQAIVRDLLCHRLGMRTFQGDFSYWTSNLTRRDVIEKMGRLKAAYPFRTTWGYTNAAFVTAGEIIPAVTGISWENFLTKKIFEPLQMARTLALTKDFVNAENHSSAHTIDEGKLIKIPIPLIDNLGAAGSIASSVNDMSHWVMAQLDRGKYNGETVIPSAAIAQTWTPHAILGNGGTMYNSGHFSLYGLGWFVDEYSGKKIVSHTGGVNGFVTSVTLIPEEKLGIIVFTNTDQNSFYEALKWEIMDAYLGNQYRNYSNVYYTHYNMQKNNEAKKTEKLKDSVALKVPAALPNNAYTGEYTNEIYGNMKVVMDKGMLAMHFGHHPNLTATLQPLGGNRFFADFNDPVFSHAVFPFMVNNGKVTGVTVKVADFIEYNPYDFKKIK